MPLDAATAPSADDRRCQCRAAMIRLGYMSGAYIDRCPKCGAIEDESCRNQNAYRAEMMVWRKCDAT